MPAVEIRNRLLDALEAEGVEITVWHVTPMTSFPIFQKLDEGYGKGCPWSCPHARQGIEYHPEDYPVSMRIVESKICFGHEHGGIAPPNGLALMEHYLHALRKVLVDNLDEVAALAARD